MVMLVPVAPATAEVFTSRFCWIPLILLPVIRVEIWNQPNKWH
jgi:hypothetical protein